MVLGRLPGGESGVISMAGFRPDGNGRVLDVDNSVARATMIQPPDNTGCSSAW